jgi:hypothetical protein
MEAIEVLLTGARQDFKPQLDQWLHQKGFSERRVKTEQYEHSPSIVFCRLSSEQAVKLHRQLKTVRHRRVLDFVDAVFPPSLIRDETVILGPAVSDQKGLIEDLRPIMATPGKRTDLRRRAARR